jgi:hypothetical protein
MKSGTLVRPRRDSTAIANRPPVPQCAWPTRSGPVLIGAQFGPTASRSRVSTFATHFPGSPPGPQPGLRKGRRSIYGPWHARRRSSRLARGRAGPRVESSAEGLGALVSAPGDDRYWGARSLAVCGATGAHPQGCQQHGPISRRRCDEAQLYACREVAASRPRADLPPVPRGSRRRLARTVGLDEPRLRTLPWSELLPCYPSPAVATPARYGC